MIVQPFGASSRHREREGMDWIGTGWIGLDWTGLQEKHSEERLEGKAFILHYSMVCPSFGNRRRSTALLYLFVCFTDGLTVVALDSVVI